MLSAESCACEITVVLRGVSITSNSIPYADLDITVVGSIRSPRLIPCTTISSRSPVAPAEVGEVGGAATAEVCEDDESVAARVDRNGGLVADCCAGAPLLAEMLAQGT